MTIEAKTIRKPAAWENETFDDLLTIEAGQAYVAEQLGGKVTPECVFVSNRDGHDTASYELFSDGSLLFTNNAEDEVWAEATDFINNFDFNGVHWKDTDDRDGLMVDEMDKRLLIHLLGKEEAREFFERSGGTVE